MGCLYSSANQCAHVLRAGRVVVGFVGRPTRLTVGIWCVLCRIVDEVGQYNVFGLGVALDMIPIITCDSAQAPDMYTEDTSNADDEPSKEPYPVMATSHLCRQMIADLVKELVDNGCLT